MVEVAELELEELELEELELEELELGGAPGIPEVADEPVPVLASEAVEGARPRFLEERTTSSRGAWPSGMPR